MRTRAVKRAFTLIEILIVVVILGILAAIVIPQFTDASGDAMDANIRSQLQTIRSQIELYNVQLPGLTYSGRAGSDDATFWNDLVNNDYLQQAPRNPRQAAATAAFVMDGSVYTGGWAFDGDDLTASDRVTLLF